MTDLERQSGLLFAYRLDGKGGGTRLDWDEVGAWKPGKGALWLHLDYQCDDSQRWLTEDSGLDAITLEGLLESDPRPRSVCSDTGLQLILRGVNHNAGAQPEDMVSVRIWVESQRIITLRHRKITAVKEVRERIARRQGPKRVGQCVVALIDSILDSLALVSDQLDDAVAKLEDQVLASERTELRRGLADWRRRAIALKRYIAPERDVLSRLDGEPATWLTEIDRLQLRELANRMTRILEDLDAARDQAAVTQEEVQNQLSELTNKRLYVLSVVAAVFLPLGMVTGLWGVNVGGIPMQDHPLGFVIITATLVVLLGLELILFRALRWL
jgi:zinc transporter